MKKDLNNTIIFACNEGGHFTQILALSELFSKYRSVLLTDNVRANFNIPALKDIYAIEYAMAFANKRKQLIRSKKILTHSSYIFAYFKLFQECSRIWNKHRPKVIVSTGSNIAVPLCIIGKLRGSKFVYIETRAKVYTKTLTGKLIGWLCDKVIVQWPEMINVYHGKAEYYGTLI